MSVFTTAGCRVRQIFFRWGRRVRPARKPSVEDGSGALFTIPQLMRSNRLRKPLLVTGPCAAPWDERLGQALEESDIAFAVWNEASDPPTADDAERLRFFWVGEGCDCFIALGGAETIDLAKAAAARAACRGKTVLGMVGHGKVGRKTPPVIAVPRLAGSGAEAVACAVVADEEGNRFRIEDPALTPAFAVLDPALFTDIPRPILADAILDGLCLAVEAYLSGYADEAVRGDAAAAVQAFFEAAEPCWNSGGNARQRSRLFTASRLAGEAASVGGFGYARALAFAARSVAGIAFGPACAVLLPAVLVKYGNSAMAPLAELAVLAGVCDEGSKAQKAAALIARIRSLCFRIDLPDTLEGIGPEAEAEIADIAAAQANPRCACPVVWDAMELTRVLRAARIHS